MEPIDPFIIKFIYDRKTYHITVTQISLNENHEQFRIGSARVHMKIETNRPFFRGRGLKHRRPTIRIITENHYAGNHFEAVMEALIDFADGKPVKPNNIVLSVFRK